MLVKPPPRRMDRNYWDVKWSGMGVRLGATGYERLAKSRAPRLKPSSP
jgi:hypothetical protein